MINPINLPMGTRCIHSIREFLETSDQKDYSLMFFDHLTDSYTTVIAEFEDYVNVVVYLINVEHDFPEWIALDEITRSYLIGMSFTRGNVTAGTYKWKDGGLTHV